MRGERKDRERNSGWERVRTRREKRESNKERAREGQCLQFAGNSRGHKQDYTRVNWRDHKDVASFYFTRFPEDTTEEALWQHFKKAGDVRDGVDWTKVDFEDNEVCLDLFEKVLFFLKARRYLFDLVFYMF